MYKVRRRTSKKKKESVKTVDGNGGKIRKTEGNIVPKRITIPPDFFKDEPALISSARRLKTDFPIDNLHGLFDKCVNIRRSKRVYNKNHRQNIESDYSPIGESSQNGLKKPDNPKSLRNERNLIFNNLTSYQEKDLKEFETSKSDKKHERSKQKQSTKKSKSIFEQINQLYARSSQDCNFGNTSRGESSNQNFCDRLAKQIGHNIDLDHQTIVACQSRILSEIKKVNDTLSGKTKMNQTPAESKCTYFYPQDNACDINFSLYNKSEWVFETPPRQRIPNMVLEESELQPAVLCTTKKEKQLFEWKKKLQIKPTDFKDKENIPISNYMDNVATTFNFNGNMRSPKSPTFSQAFASAYNCDANQPTRDTDNFLKPATVDRGHPLMTVLTRPQKSTIKKAITFTRVKRKFDTAMETTIDLNSPENKNKRTNGNLFGIEENEDFKFHPMETVVNEYQNLPLSSASSLNNLLQKNFDFLPKNSSFTMDIDMDENENSFTFDSLQVKTSDFHF
ncbi:uncharacterized protein LOC126888351 [Diabrotica virgifera virgifera]|uniref:Uncharacterized protein n=2 Tax=Diabrotica virgifera virgifera TaxID=50390 RepID=A0ABM5KQL4_DIAVI|nr:uncharacterized protein LOC126888351 [Diabrotica virgifera virgifera]